MKVIDAVSEILKREGVEFLSCYPTTPLIDAAARSGIRPILCRQERSGVGIADGFSRTTNGRRIGVFAMQQGPGAENAFSGVATAYSDSVPILVLPLGHPRDRARIFPNFSSARAYGPVTKWVEELNVPGRLNDVMRRAFSQLKLGRPGPVMVEIPADVAVEDVGEFALAYEPVKRARACSDPVEVKKAARALVEARNPVIYAGQGVLYGEAWGELLELAELLDIPVTTTLEGKSVFPEDHPLSLGTGAGVMTRPVVHFLQRADLVLAIGCSLTRHGIATASIPSGKIIIHATNDERDINKDYVADYPILGDAKLVLRQFIDSIQDGLGKSRRNDGLVRAEITKSKDEWLSEWMNKLKSTEVPLNPYRIIWEFMRVVNPNEAIVTHDSGSPREQLVPFYRATRPRSYIGWGKSHALGTGLGLIMGAKLAQPEKFCVNFMGDAAFGMTGLDFETAVRCGIPVLTIVLNNSSMAIEIPHLTVAHERYRARDIAGNYAELARALGGYAERVERPEEIAPAIERARRATVEGKAALLEFVTREEISFSHKRALDRH